MLALVVGSGTAVVGAALLASLLRPRSAITFVLATYLFAWAELLVVVFSLSAISSLDRRSLLAGLVVASAVAGVAWILAGRPTPPPLAAALRRGRDAASDPLVAILLVACGLALTYTLFITLTTAPNDGDPLVYEITRAAFWHQHHGVTNLHSAYDERIDVWPPVAEIGTLAVITLSENERYVGLVQWLAVWMLALGTYGVGRRIGLERPSALFGAALVPTLPVVLTQSWTAFTDMVFASFAVSAVYFGIGPLGLELVAFGAAVGLATGTKYLGPIFAPLFAVILGVAQPRRRWLPLAGAALAGAGTRRLVVRPHADRERGRPRRPGGRRAAVARRRLRRHDVPAPERRGARPVRRVGEGHMGLFGCRPRGRRNRASAGGPSGSSSPRPPRRRSSARGGAVRRT